MTFLKDHIAQIQKLCSQHSVKALFAFGSVTKGGFRADSDVDLIVDIDALDPLEYADNYFALKFELQQLLQREIDLLEQKAIKNPFLKKGLDQTKVLLYGKGNFRHCEESSTKQSLQLRTRQTDVAIATSRKSRSSQ